MMARNGSRTDADRCRPARSRTLLNRGSLVVFDYDGPRSAPGPALLRTMNRTLGARDANVPAIFGLNGRELAKLLNGYRMQAQSGGSESQPCEWFDGVA